jgi:mannosylglycoprotein endo-beta-mannosidase
VAAKGHSGGILLGVKEDGLQVEDWCEGEFYMAATVKNRIDNWRWNIIIVYGPADHTQSKRFLEEIGGKCRATTLPTIIGGDFNLVRETSDKSNGVANKGLMRAFNDFIANNELREIHREGGKFTWTNNQSSPIMSNIDRVMATTNWEVKNPTCTLTSLTRIGSDHNPILLDTGVNFVRKRPQFFFEKQWNKLEGFNDLVKEKWLEFKVKSPPGAYSLNVWQGMIANLRRFLRGWGANVRGDYRKEREKILAEIQAIDAEEDCCALCEIQVRKRQEMEVKLEELMESEEIYWQQRGGEKWILEGDGNTTFFHLVANGRRRKSPSYLLNMRGCRLLTKNKSRG